MSRSCALFTSSIVSRGFSVGCIIRPPNQQQPCLFDGAPPVFGQPSTNYKTAASGPWFGSHASSGEPCRVSGKGQRPMALLSWWDTHHVIGSPADSSHFQRESCQAKTHHTFDTAAASSRPFIQQPPTKHRSFPYTQLRVAIDDMQLCPESRLGPGQDNRT